MQRLNFTGPPVVNDGVDSALLPLNYIVIYYTVLRMWSVAPSLLKSSQGHRHTHPIHLSYQKPLKQKDWIMVHIVTILFFGSQRGLSVLMTFLVKPL